MPLPASSSANATCIKDRFVVSVTHCTALQWADSVELSAPAGTCRLLFRTKLEDASNTRTAVQMSKYDPSDGTDSAADYAFLAALLGVMSLSLVFVLAAFAIG